ncbi:hypothetical protein EOPP23_10535 [Endozoicomonas sp. OPT23]|uniref:protein kinase domain-containing protein n=1 Tax=Endozoicomonas sp. OPT23 TaxID=2072845 RepID=UPI00129B37A8|nr:protein kinase [Endozoicomonas sp. OPT23]MRI33421.1 hypothetical protein [Endozoicomonas sp. OPT23]
MDPLGVGAAQVGAVQTTGISSSTGATGYSTSGRCSVEPTEVGSSIPKLEDSKKKQPASSLTEYRINPLPETYTLKPRHPFGRRVRSNNFTTIVKHCAGITLEKVLGSGSFASVLLGHTTDGHPLAVKLFNENSKTDSNAQLLSLDSGEAIALKHSEHENMPKCHALFLQDLRDKSVVLINSTLLDTIQDKRNYQIVAAIYDYIPGGDLFNFLHVYARFSYSSETAVKIVLPICKVLSSLHNYNIVHRDVKVENILLDMRDNTPKLCDWGFVTKTSAFTPTYDYYGSAPYSPPEIFKYPPTSDSNTDCWGAGLLLAEIAFDYIPTKTTAALQRDLEPSPENMQSRILHFAQMDDKTKKVYLKRLIKNPSPLDDQMIDLIIALTRNKGRDRLSMREAVERLESMLKQIPIENRELRASTPGPASEEHIRVSSLPSSLSVSEAQRKESNPKRHRKNVSRF